ncbi:hypothetical protein [Streptomyces sp. NPDC059278]|uniref:hypothetical protein n=1 Tax=Streptomyces sp. NPDC059278 TaxID=3346801 RepID=UPI0036CFB210
MLFHTPDYNASANGHDRLAAKYDRMAATSTGLMREIAQDRADLERSWAASDRAKAKRRR